MCSSDLTLKRLRRPIGDVLRTYKVVIDGNRVGDIRRGETKTFDVPPGQHEIHLEIDWAKSRNLELNLSSGDVATLTCSARPPNSGWTALASKNYIKLEIVDGSWLAVGGRPLADRSSSATVGPVVRAAAIIRRPADARTLGESATPPPNVATIFVRLLNIPCRRC